MTLTLREPKQFKKIVVAARAAHMHLPYMGWLRIKKCQQWLHSGDTDRQNELNDKSPSGWKIIRQNDEDC